MIEALSKTDYVKKILKKKILDGEFPPASKIPPEPELVDQFGVGRNTIREIISALAHEGLLQKFQGKGTFVRTDFAYPQARTNTLIGLAHHFRNETIDIFSHIQNYALDNESLLVAYNVNEDAQDPALEKKFLEKAEREMFKGLIVLPTPHQPLNTDIYARLRSKGIKVVLIAPYKKEMDNEVSFLFDYEQAGYTAAAKLGMSGFKKICFARKYMSIPHFIMQAAAAQACRDLNLDFIEDFHFVEGADNQKFLKKLPCGTGIISSQTSLGYELHDACMKSGIRIPEDIGLCSISDYKKAGLPAISCLVTPQAEQLQSAVDYIMNSGTNAGDIIHRTFKFKYEEHGTVVRV